MNNGVGYAKFQILQMYDDEWIADLVAAGHPDKAETLKAVLNDVPVGAMAVIELRDLMINAMAQRD